MGKRSSSIFGHKSLESVFQPLIDQVCTKYSVIVRQLGQDRSEEVQFHRFLNNAKVSPKRLVDFHWQRCSITAFKARHLLMISDTTTISFTADSRREYLGYVPGQGQKDGFTLHPAIAIDALDGGCYGVGGIRFHRTEKPPAEGTEKIPDRGRKRSSAYLKKPFEANERYKWFDAPNKAITNLKGASSYTLVGDRESDFYELIARTVEQNWHFLYRGKTNRRLSKDTDQNLFATIASWKVAHHYDLNLPATKKRSAHVATLDLKFGQVSIPRPAGHPNKSLIDQVEVNIVEVKERASTVVGNEKPIHWTLLTSHPVESVEQALQIVNWYRWRWIIEQLFRAFKSKGLDIENAELKTFHGIANLATVALLAAVQVIQLVQARQGQTAQLLEHAFNEQETQCLQALNTKLEGKTQKQKNPHPPQSLAYASWIVARLGGWKGYASERPPGPITMTRGLTQFYAILEGFYLRL